MSRHLYTIVPDGERVHVLIIEGIRRKELPPDLVEYKTFSDFADLVLALHLSTFKRGKKNRSVVVRPYLGLADDRAKWVDRALYDLGFDVE